MTDTMPAGWWAAGLALAERPAGDPVSTDLAKDRLGGWRAAFGPRFSERLAADGLDEDALLGLLAEPPRALAARVQRPAWAETVEHAIHTATPQQVDTTDWRAAFAVPIRPFVTNAVADLTSRVATIQDLDRLADLPAITAAFADRLSRRLTGIATRTLVHELNTGLAAGRTTGAADFATQLTEPAALAGLCATYPVLARLLGQASTFHTDAAGELLTRFATDRATVVTTLFGGTDPGRLTEIRAGLGDTHRRGRGVAVLTFAGGAKLVYKPRDLGAHERFAHAVRWLNTVVSDLELRTAAAVTRDGYGWVEFVPAAPLPDLAAADRFYRRHGGLLALLHALHAADMHFENVIACGDQPVPVDVETLFHPSLTAPDSAPDPAARALSESVQRTGLLPVVVAGEGGAADVSALGGSTVTDVVTDWAPDERGALREVRKQVSRTGAGNLPNFDGRPVGVAAHEKALLAGFRLAYDAILRHRTEFIDLLEQCGDDEVRVAVRHSAGYTRLLTESTRPELLRDGLVRDQALDLLWTESTRHPLRWRVCRDELADLWALDVPLFTTRPGSADLWSATGRRLPGALDRPGLANALTKVNAMSEIDRRDQEWIITAALATTRPTGQGHHPAPALPGHMVGTAAPPDRLLVAACTIADQIVARHLAHGERVNWLGLEHVDDTQWLVLPMGAGLGNGYLGVALFLAQVAELSGIARYADMAHRALRGLPGLFDLMARRPDLVATIGCGGFHGFGGIAYGLARLAGLLDDHELADATRTAVDLAAAAARTPGPPDVAGGAAGCLAAMTAVHAELGLASAAALAEDCAAGLTELVRATGMAGTPPGFLGGAAGITWALDRAAGLSRRGGPESATHSNPASPGWRDAMAGGPGGAAGPAMASVTTDVSQQAGTTRPVGRSALSLGRTGAIATGASRSAPATSADLSRPAGTARPGSASGAGDAGSTGPVDRSAASDTGSTGHGTGSHGSDSRDSANSSGPDSRDAAGEPAGRGAGTVGPEVAASSGTGRDSRTSDTDEPGLPDLAGVIARPRQPGATGGSGKTGPVSATGGPRKDGVVGGAGESGPAGQAGEPGNLAATAGLGWCAGIAGLVMAGSGDLDELLADRPVLADLSLCHGELGIADALIVAGVGETVRRRRAGLILDAYTRHGACCGTPGGVTTPGLLTGLAGIGYGLLRLGFADRVPSVLLLEPAHY
jgi:type 2 lantibiotic biosynthesis protein LanM